MNIPDLSVCILSKTLKTKTKMNNQSIDDKKAALKEYKRLWRLKNKEHIKQYNAQYFQDNITDIIKKRYDREQIEHKHLEYQHKRVNCVCGKEMFRANLYYHRRICITYKNSIQITSENKTNREVKE